MVNEVFEPPLQPTAPLGSLGFVAVGWRRSGSLDGSPGDGAAIGDEAFAIHALQADGVRQVLWYTRPHYWGAPARRFDRPVDDE